VSSELERPQVSSPADQIDTLCDSFESLWRAGTRPEIVHYLDKVAFSDRPAVLRELLAIELELRRGLGERPCLTDELGRFPGLEDAVHMVFAHAQSAVPTDPPVPGTVTRTSETVSMQAEGSSGRMTTDGAGVGRAAGQSLGDYEILQEIARGGMGVVYKARQKKANRIVALKMILSGQLAGPEEVNRFYTEAEAAANLDHPNIVPVYDVGEVNGQHYFSMGYVDGPSLKQRVQQGPLPPREAAQLVKTIAEAVHYAHQKGVLHRDLKPANVLLQTAMSDERSGMRDEGSSASKSIISHPSSFIPRISDFGLAKRLDEESGQTHTGQVMGTPSYMPPEQAAGKIAELGPAADVYSLGAILYELLTGRPPFQAASALEILAQVLKQDPIAPLSLNARIPRDVETITLKCLEKEPAKRYGSARELADDLGRYLDGEPIVARPVSAVERVWRWSRRHPAAAGAIAAVVVGLLSVSALSVALWNTNANLRRANRAEAAATHEATTKQKEAEDAAQVAREQSQLALKSLEYVIFDVQRGLTNVPGAGAVKRKLIQDALARLEQISDQYAARSAIDRNTKVALDELGDLFLRIGSDPNSPSPRSRGEGRSEGDSAAGPLTAARKVYAQAMDIAKRLAAADPLSAQAQFDLSISYERLGDVQRRSGQVTEALVSYQKKLEISQKLAAAYPSDDTNPTLKPEVREAQLNLSFSYERLGDVQLQGGQATEALRSYEKALGIRQKLAAADPSDAGAQRDLSVSYNRLGDVQLQSGQVTDALRSYEKCLEISQKLAAADPTDAQAQRDLSVSYMKLGDVQLQSGQVTDALRSYEKCLEISQKLAADPTDAQAQRDLSVLYNKLGDVQLQSGQVTEALRSYEKDLEISEKLAALDPTDAQAQSDRSASYLRLGDVQLLSGQVTKALEWFQKALEISAKLAAADPTNAQAQRNLCISYLRLGDVQLLSGQVTEALGWFQKALEISAKLAAADPSDAQAQHDLSSSYLKLGDVQLQSGQMTEALRSNKKGLEISAKLAAADPTNAQAQRNLCISYLRLGDVQRQNGQVTDALRSHKKGLEISEKLAAADPTNAQTQRDLFASYAKLGNVQLQSGQVTEALGSHKKGLEISQKLAAADTTNAQAQLDLSRNFYNLGEAEMAGKQFEKAIGWYEKAAAKVKSLQESGRLAPQDKNTLSMLEQRIQQCRHAGIALGDWKTLLEQPPPMLPALLEMRGTESVQAGRPAEAVQAVAKLRELGTATADQLYNAACVYSLCASRLGAAPSLPPEQSAARQQHIADALATLREAIAAGYMDFAHIQQDPDLTPLHDLPGFKALLPRP
jgi:serine/threonine protein kinase/tetratricopeptide (TPR) repeat protein